MTGEANDDGKGMSRRKFMVLAGATAAFGAFVLANAVRSRALPTSPPSTSASQTYVTQGRYVTVPGAAAAPSLMSRLLGGRL